MTNPKTLILGLGNPILSDDGVGLVVARRIREKLRGGGRWSGMTVLATPVAGVGLLDLVSGYEHLFLIDAFLAEGGGTGELRILHPSDPDLQHYSSHGFDLLGVLRLGKELSLPVPDLRAVYGIAVTPDPPFGEELSAEMGQKAEGLAERIIAHIRLLHPPDAAPD